MTTTASRLKLIMEEEGLKQADIVARAKPFSDKYGGKLTRQDISQYCSGKVKPAQEKLFLLAAALNVNEAWLMGYDVDRARWADKVSEMEEKITGHTTEENNLALFKKMLADQYFWNTIVRAYYLPQHKKEDIYKYINYVADMTDKEKETSSTSSAVG